MQRLSYATKSSRFAATLTCARALLDSLPTVMWFVRRNMRRLKKTGLSVSQFRALVILDRMVAPTLKQVAENLGATLPTTSRIVSGLVKKGYVERKDLSDDRRCLALTITKHGRKTYQHARSETMKLVAAELEDLTVEERTRLIETMDTLGSIFTPEGARMTMVTEKRN